MGIWSDFFDPFSSVQSDRARQAKADARARGRAAYQASAEAVRDGVNRACEVESAMGTATEPDRELEQANKEIRAFARRAGEIWLGNRASVLSELTVITMTSAVFRSGGVTCRRRKKISF